MIASLFGLWVVRRGDSRSDRDTGKATATAALIAGTAAILVFNDSGVVAAANVTILWWAAQILRRYAESATARQPDLSGSEAAGDPA